MFIHSSLWGVPSELTAVGMTVSMGHSIGVGLVPLCSRAYAWNLELRALSFLSVGGLYHPDFLSEPSAFPGGPGGGGRAGLRASIPLTWGPGRLLSWASAGRGPSGCRVCAFGTGWGSNAWEGSQVSRSLPLRIGSGLVQPRRITAAWYSLGGSAAAWYSLRGSQRPDTA